MNLELRAVGDVDVAEVHGSLDTASAMEFETKLVALVEAGAKKVVVDLRRMSYSTSSGLRVLLAVAKRLRGRGGELVVAGLTPTAQDVFEVSGLVTLLRVFGSVDAAIEEI